jgi:hypothetical protein
VGGRGVGIIGEEESGGKPEGNGLVVSMKRSRRRTTVGGHRQWLGGKGGA